MIKVSIPFKRESGSKAERFRVEDAQDDGFNSLQTGKRIQRAVIERNNVTVTEFQFPSNGKADPKKSWRWAIPDYLLEISIPFKRESVSKAEND